MTYLVIRDWLSHDFIDNCHRLKPFSEKKMQFLVIKKKNNFRKNCVVGFGLFDLCIVHLHFLRGMNLQFSTIAVSMHFFMFYMRICTYFGVRFMSIGVEIVLGTKQTLKRNLSIIPLVSISKISSLYLAPVAAQAGLSLPGRKLPKTGFLMTRLI